MNKTISSTELTLSEFDDPPSNVDRVSTINNQQYQFHNDYDNENGFTSENGSDDAALHNALNRGPYFELSASKNVTALVGNTAYLNCRVRNLGNKTVMQFRSIKFWFYVNGNSLTPIKGNMDSPQRFAFADCRQGDLHTR